MVHAGFEHMLLDFGEWCNGYDLEYPEKSVKNRNNGSWKVILDNPSAIEDEIQSYMDYILGNGLSVPVAYFKSMDFNKENMHLLEAYSELVKAYIRACGKYHCKYMILPPISIEGERGSMWELNRDYYMQFAEIAKEQDVMILLSNQTKDFNDHWVRGICSSPYEAVSWIDELNAEAGKLLQEEVEVFGLMLDVVNCNLCGVDIYEYIEVLGSRIKAVFLSDSNGHEKASLLPFTCAIHGQYQTDWLGVIRGLRSIGFDGEMIINFSDMAAYYPMTIRPQLLVLAKSIANYFKWQIELEKTLKKYKNIVLFGAGNMCHNYMESYGEKYPPLFTCDNNPEIWGTKFCGLEVKSPEKLKRLPEDCAIFICNMYYYEIEQQLREMGIKNPIEYYSDEYMPLFEEGL